MMIAIWLLYLQAIAQTCFAAETFPDLRLQVASSKEVDLRKRISGSKLISLMKIYDDVLPDSRAEGGSIPHWNCSVPFYLTNGSGPLTCTNDRLGRSWCSYDRIHNNKSHWNYCSMRARDSDVADPNKWEAPKKCSPLFIKKERSLLIKYYFKGCTNLDQKKPWCSHNIEYKEDNNWSFCIDTATVGRWSPWSPWNICSQTCGSGTKKRIRSCIIPIQGGRTCSGDSSETVKCFLSDCPTERDYQQKEVKDSIASSDEESIKESATEDVEAEAAESVEAISHDVKSNSRSFRSIRINVA